MTIAALALDDALGQGFLDRDAGRARGCRHGLAFREIDWGAIRPNSGAIVAPRDDSAPRRRHHGGARNARRRTGRRVPVGHVFVLRPDRYVAACVPLEQWHRRRADIVSLIGATFDRGSEDELPERRVLVCHWEQLCACIMSRLTSVSDDRAGARRGQDVAATAAIAGRARHIQNNFSEGAEHASAIYFSRLRQDK